MSTIGARSYTQLNNDVRYLLNDMAGLVYSDGVLVSPDAMAYSMCESEFEGAGVPVTDKIDLAATYTAAADHITPAAGDVYEVTQVWQRLTSADAWMLVEPRTMANILPPDPVAPIYLQQWAWDNANQRVYVTPAQQSLQIALYYQTMGAYQPSGSPSTTAVGNDDFYWCMGFKVAEIAAGNTGRSDLNMKYGGMYAARLALALNRRVRLQQKVMRSPRAYRHH